MNNISLFYKIFIVFISIFTISVGFVSWYGFSSAKKAYTDSAYENNSQKTYEIKTKIIKEMNPISKNIEFLTNSYALDKYFIWKSMNEYKKVNAYKKIFSDSLLDFLKTQKEYYKFRIIDLDSKETLTAKYTSFNDKAFILSNHQLQNKRGRDYVEEAMKLEKGDFYLSDMNLNVENNEIQKPYIPVIRYSTPIVDKNLQTKAIFVSTVYAKNILKILSNMATRDKDKSINYYLLDEEGDYLYHKNSSYMWNKQLHNGHNFNTEFFNLKNVLESRDNLVFQNNDKIYSVHKVYPSREFSDQFWYIVSSQEKDIALASLGEFKKIFYIIFLLVLVVGFFVVRYFAHSITQPISQVSDKLKSLSLGDMRDNTLISYRHDALGDAMIDLVRYIKSIQKQSEAITKGNYDYKVEIKSEFDYLGMSLRKMNDMLAKTREKNENDIWFSDGIGSFSDSLSGNLDITKLANESISKVCLYMGANSGVIYRYDEKNTSLEMLGKYASSTYSTNIILGDGLVGQVALDKKAIYINDINEHNHILEAAGNNIKASEIYIAPIIYQNVLFGVIEVATINKFNDIKIAYIDRVIEILGNIFHNTTQGSQIKGLLEESKRAYEELQVQSEELQESNVQMEEQQQQLTLQTKQMRSKNEELTIVKDQLDIRAYELERSSKYKSEFLANMSHELRTPLNSIILLSKLLTQNKNDTLSKEDTAKTEVINKAGNDLLLLINDILDLSKIESGNMELHEIPTSSIEIFGELDGLFSEVANEKGLKFNLSDEFGGSFIADKTKLLQILKNLLSNAFKFTKHGEVNINLVQKNNKLIFDVSDTGLGIPKDKLELIFEAFKQVDGSISRNYGGTGLGLSISKTFVDLMDGDIVVESIQGNGSSFKIIIPFNRSMTLDIQDEEIKIEENVILENDEIFDKDIFKNKNILIVDDDSRNIFTLSSTLQELGAETYSAMDGSQALELLEKQKIDVVLMDLMMPIMDGLDATKKMKADDRFKDIPVIVITAKTMQEDKDNCFKAGADDYLSKPIDHGALISMIKAWCR